MRPLKMNFFPQIFLFLFLLFAMAITIKAEGKMITRTVEYQDGKDVLEGYLAYDPSRFKNLKAPGILVVHEWMGLNSYTKKRVEQLAGEGYIAFAADIYGKGIRPKNPKEAGQMASKFKADRSLLRRRVNVALEYLKNLQPTQKENLVAIGYCFGGTTVLELARSGADVKGVVSFHGGLDTPNPDEAKNIKAKVLVLHGANDPFVPNEQVLPFQEEMKKAHVDWQFISYGGAVHSFTNPESGSDSAKGAAYHEKADKRSWEAMQIFLHELFGD